MQLFFSANVCFLGLCIFSTHLCMEKANFIVLCSTAEVVTTHKSSSVGTGLMGITATSPFLSPTPHPEKGTATTKERVGF